MDFFFSFMGFRWSHGSQKASWGRMVGPQLVKQPLKLFNLCFKISVKLQQQEVKLQVAAASEKVQGSLGAASCVLAVQRLQILKSTPTFTASVLVPLRPYLDGWVELKSTKWILWDDTFLILASFFFSRHLKMEVRLNERPNEKSWNELEFTGWPDTWLQMKANFALCLL